MKGVIAYCLPLWKLHITLFLGAILITTQHYSPRIAGNHFHKIQSRVVSYRPVSKTFLSRERMLQVLQVPHHIHPCIQCLMYTGMYFFSRATSASTVLMAEVVTSAVV